MSLPTDSALTPQERELADRPAKTAKASKVPLFGTYRPFEYVNTYLEPLADGRLLVATGSNPSLWKIVNSFDEVDGSIYLGPVEEVKGESRLVRELDDDPPTVRLALCESEVWASSIKTPGDLLQDIITFSKKYVEIDDQDRFLAAAMVVLSYFQDYFSALPYLRFRGDYGTGKSRAMEVFGAGFYKVLCCGGGATVAAVKRLLNKWRGSLAYDEADFAVSDETSAIAKLLNPRYKDDSFSTYMACDQNDHNKVEILRLFGATALATRLAFKDEATESRCLTIHMREVTRERFGKDIPITVKDDLVTEREVIRQNLTTLRLLRKIEGWTPQPVPPGFWGDLELEPRMKEVLDPLVRLFDDERDRDMIQAFAKRIHAERIKERAGSDKGLVAMAIHTLIEEGFIDLRASIIAEELEKDNFGLGTTRIGLILGKNGFGFEGIRQSGKTHYHLDSEENIHIVGEVLRKYVPDCPIDEILRRLREGRITQQKIEIEEVRQ